MKTAIQELIDELEMIYDDKYYDMEAKAVRECIMSAKSYLDLEKSKIIDAFKSGLNSDCLQEQNEDFFAEQYYKKTFNL